MKSNKKLIESKVTDKDFQDFLNNPATHPTLHPFMKTWNENYKKHLMETAGNTSGGTVEPEIGVVRGQTLGDAVNAAVGTVGSENFQVVATLEVFNSVIRGFTRYMDDSFVRKYTTDSVQFKIPITEYQELVSGISAGELPHTEKKLAYVTIDLSTPESEKGGKVTWTRSLLEDVTFDIQAEMLEGLGHAIAKEIMLDIIVHLFGINKGESEQATYWAATAGAGPATLTISSTITWAEFLAIIAAVDKGTVDSSTLISSSRAGTAHALSDYKGYKTYGPADYVLVSADIYWQLLQIIQMTNVLYEGSTDPVKEGKIKLALGCTIVKESLMPQGTVIALNSEKAIALVTRRSLKLEPVLFPVWNEYGFIGTVRYGISVIFPAAIAIGATAAGGEYGGLDAITVLAT